ncbi:hypothetical protein ERJ75_001586700 [Trypanosoma vivax]|uniref:Uncharacterized protein n=1 Tax=Trypanosoma vivax (strain Y486) TaxID=1055687 RepID=F9WVH7_TRYVY|nr:hypothetical protein ERJ75_001586700 [Trypanosoma vivax]CCD21585.1 hypothetical protein, conserved in T. vivax [Trypanosoma vivax Y486]|eukprot:CCD21585.1 hypothetical protein, conserved in T. vivax [Trypanosoma vivax Y486]
MLFCLTYSFSTPLKTPSWKQGEEITLEMTVAYHVALLLAATLCCGATANVFASEHGRQWSPCEAVNVFQRMGIVFEALSGHIKTFEKDATALRRRLCSLRDLLGDETLTTLGEKVYNAESEVSSPGLATKKLRKDLKKFLDTAQSESHQLRSVERSSNFSDSFQTCNNTMGNNERTKEDVLRAIGEGWESVVAWVSDEKSRLEAEENEAIRASLGPSSQAPSAYDALLRNFVELVTKADAALATVTTHMPKAAAMLSAAKQAVAEAVKSIVVKELSECRGKEVTGDMSPLCKTLRKMSDGVQERSGEMVSAREVGDGRPAPSTAKSSDGATAPTEADADAPPAASGNEALMELLGEHASQGNKSAHRMPMARVVFYANIPVVLVVVLVLAALRLIQLWAKRKMLRVPRREAKEETDVISSVSRCVCVCMNVSE